MTPAEGRPFADGARCRPRAARVTISRMHEYLVRTDIYNGPMDLLLYLIRRNEVDLYDIPVADITRQYVEYVNVLQSIDPNVAGEFLVMAATLLEIKSRMLLPRQVANADEEEDLSDPRLELVRQLLEYKKFKDASFELSAAAETQAAKWPRIPVKIAPAPAGEVDMDDVQIWDLVAAFNQIMTSIGVRPATHDVVFDDTPIALHAVDIMDRLQRDNGELQFAAIFVNRTKSEMVGLFLALLELMRQQRVRVSQEHTGAAIHVTLLSAEPIVIGDEWEQGGKAREVERAAATRFDDVPSGPNDIGMAGDDDAVDSLESVPGADEDPDDDDESFADLDLIKTDVDIEAVLKAGQVPVREDEDEVRS